MPAATKAKPRIEAPTSVPRPLRGWWEIPAAARLSAAEARGLLLLGHALIVNAILLAPEIRIERVPVNDLRFHMAASQRLAQSLITGDSFLDPWMSLWALGYPLWHFYQPIPHMVAGVASQYLVRPNSLVVSNVWR